MIDLAVEMLVPDEVRARHLAKFPGVLALGTTILVVSFILVYFAEWFRRRGVQLKTSSGV
jgi:hypothetical protein